MPRTSRLVIAALALTWLSGCSALDRPKVEPFYSVTVPPRKQELRWSNGNRPKSLDPARAAAAPETDIIRAVYEGLTDLDGKSLREIPGVAEKWDSTNDMRTWTFHLRKNARWSNGELVTAKDFVGSWKRLSKLGDKGSHSYLFQNIVGMGSKEESTERPAYGPNDMLRPPSSPAAANPFSSGSESNILPKSQLSVQALSEQKSSPESRLEVPGQKTNSKPAQFGVEAINEMTLRVNLVLPDKDFPKLVSHPIFRPVYGDGSNFDKPGLELGTVTNGAFEITKIEEDDLTVERSEKYWNRESVALEQVVFVAKSSAEAALEAYRKGEVDIVTNATFEPLALKLLTPYDDFRRTAHNALNFYEFNTDKPPFNDRRIREALAIAIDRAKLTEGDLDGSNQPATSFFPFGEQSRESILHDTSRAKELLEKAGYPDGKGFSPIRLVINRNDTQHRVAKAVARMWKQTLNIDTEIVIKELDEISTIKKAGDYDLLRRGVVLPTNDELVNLKSVLGSARKVIEKPVSDPKSSIDTNILIEKPRPILKTEENKSGPIALRDKDSVADNTTADLILNEADAIFELRVIPLYFPMSYSLVKPYIRGFEINGLDAPSLKEVSIDNTWQPIHRRGES